MLEVEHLNLIYQGEQGPVHAVRDISFSVEEGEFYTLLGPSGCGKTSILRSIAGLERPTAGRIVIGGTAVFDSNLDTVLPTHHRPIGMVFQSYAIWPHMSVVGNVVFPLLHGPDKMGRREAHARALQALELVQLGHFAERPAPQLSGGQQQRVALARALVHEPQVLLLDEPLSNLDAKLREEMRRELKDLAERLNTTTLYVTHDQVEALAMSDRIAVMDAGRIMQEGQPRAIYLEPSSHFVARFLGTTNSLEGVIRGGPEDGGLVNVETACGALKARMTNQADDGATVLVIARPEAILLTRNMPSEPTNVFAATVDAASFVGDSMEYRVTLAGTQLSVHGSPFDPLDEGEGAFVYLAPERCLLVHDDDGFNDDSSSVLTASDSLTGPGAETG